MDERWDFLTVILPSLLLLFLWLSSIITDSGCWVKISSSHGMYISIVISLFFSLRTVLAHSVYIHLLQCRQPIFSAPIADALQLPQWRIYIIPFPTSGRWRHCMSQLTYLDTALSYNQAKMLLSFDIVLDVTHAVTFHYSWFTQQIQNKDAYV